MSGEKDGNTKEGVGQLNIFCVSHISTSFSLCVSPICVSSITSDTSLSRFFSSCCCDSFLSNSVMLSG